MKKKKKEMKKSQIFQIVNCQKFAVSLKCTIRCEPFPMGLINSLHHHKSTLAVTVAEFYVFAACAHLCVFMCVFFFSLSRGARANSLGIFMAFELQLLIARTQTQREFAIFRDVCRKLAFLFAKPFSFGWKA